MSYMIYLYYYLRGFFGLEWRFCWVQNTSTPYVKVGVQLDKNNYLTPTPRKTLSIK